MRKQTCRSETAKLISAFVFTVGIVQFYFLNLKFPASSCLQWLYSTVIFGPGQKSQCWFTRVYIYVHQSCKNIVVSYTMLKLTHSPLARLSEDGSSMSETWAHFPYISITAYSFDGRPVAATPWSIPLT